jgi:hypothetical protein
VTGDGKEKALTNHQRKLVGKLKNGTSLTELKSWYDGKELNFFPGIKIKYKVVLGRVPDFIKI